MSVKAQNWVWQHSRAHGIDRLVELAIADRANDDGEDAWPNMETLCQKTRLSRSTVGRSVKALEELGELRVDREIGKRNSYVLTMPLYETDADQPEGAARPARVARPANQCQPDTGESDNGTGVNLTHVSGGAVGQADTGINETPVSPVTPLPVSTVTPPPVSLLTHKTSCTSSTSSTHTPRASDGEPRRQGSLIGRGETLAWSRQQDRAHQGCHPEVCNWRGTTRGICLPALLVPKFAEKLIGVEGNAAIADVVAWARSDAPPAGSVATGDDFKFWRDRWAATRATPRAPDHSKRIVPGVAETDALLEEMTGGRLR